MDDRSADTRRKILDEALALFADRGFAGTTTRAIGAAAEVNIATIDYHFGGKQGLYDAVVVRLYEDLASVFVVRDVDPDVEIVLRALWAFARSHRTHIKLLVRHTLDHDRLPGVVTERWSGLLLDAADAYVARRRPEWARTRRRVFVLGTMHALVRLAITDDAWLTDAVGGGPDAVIDGLVDDVRSALG
jgi:AcrR family transcriptional regulator